MLDKMADLFHRPPVEHVKEDGLRLQTVIYEQI